MNGKYRPDIDGLRAIAVLSVVLYHLGVGLIPGGFVGVDIFFVISGFLITGIINTEISSNSFSLKNFYYRRIRRIFPALFVVCFVTILFAWQFYMPVEFKELGESLTALSLFSSNIYFELKSGYFDNSSAIRPLLHTWSLSVEEQYYAFFPLILMAISKFKRIKLIPTILFIWLASFIASIFEVYEDQTSAFYLIWYRAWELLTGSLLALLPTKAFFPTTVNKFSAPIGLLLIIISVFLYSDHTLFPGASAFIPVFGTALVIYAGNFEKNYTLRLLGAEWFVFFGAISYSLYLWHWPILVLTRYLFLGDLPINVVVVCLFSTFFISFISWKYIEQPFRQQSRMSIRAAYTFAFISLLSMFAGGIFTRILHGIPQRLPDEVVKIANIGLDINPMRKQCDSIAVSKIDANDVCIIGNQNSPIKFALIGDSFADSLSPGVDEQAKQFGQAGYVLTRGGCVPLLGSNQENSKHECRDFLDAAVRLINRTDSIESVILIGRWTTFAEGTRFGVNNTSELFVTDDQSTEQGYAENKHVFERSLVRTLEAFNSRKIYLVAYIPEQPKNIPQTMGIKKLLGSTDYGIGLDKEIFNSRQSFVRETITRLGNNYKFHVIDIGKELCNSVICIGEDNGIPLYVDDNHLSKSEAINLSYVFKPVFSHLSE